jgi:hypothetical protein
VIHFSWVMCYTLVQAAARLSCEIQINGASVENFVLRLSLLFMDTKNTLI